MSAINVNSITGRTGTHGPVLTGVTTATNGLNITGGSVGIGTDNTSAKLQIKGTGSSTGLTLLTTDAVNNNTFWLKDGGAAGFHYYPFAINRDSGDDIPSGSYFYVHGTSPFIIKSNGRVGVGITNPEKELEVSGSSSPTIRINNSDGSISADQTIGAIEFKANDGSNDGSQVTGSIESISQAAFTGQGSPSDLIFKTNGPSGANALTERLRIDSAGRVLKGWNGTAFDGPSNSTDIAVAGTLSNNGIQVGRYNTAYGAYALTIFRSRGTSIGTNLPTLSNDDVGHITWWGDDGTNWRDVAEITGACDGNTDSGSSPGKIIFKTTKDNATDSTQAMTIKANHNVEIHDGNIVFETAGNGIDFSATSGTGTSELLDDYEEGTWTPTVTAGYFSSTPVTGGTYTKIGNLVTIQATLQSSTSSNMTIDTSAVNEQTRTGFIQGLPFGMQQTASTTFVRLYSWGAQSEIKGLQAGIYPAGSYNTLTVSQTTGSVTGFVFVFTLTGRIN